MNEKRIVWKAGKSGGRWMWALGPGFWGGGTCEHKGQVHVYDELVGLVEEKGGTIFWKGQSFCPSDQVAAIISK